MKLKPMTNKTLKKYKMKTELLKIFNLRHFFQIVQINEQNIKYSLEKPSNILLQNIHTSWLQSILLKTHKHLPVYLNSKKNISKRKKIPFGFITDSKIENEPQIFKQHLNECAPEQKKEMKFNLLVPEQDTMQYFIQWQRYRKFWWSSITTTPSLFSIGDIKHGENYADVNIVAKFPWGSEPVETLNIKSKNTIIENASHLTCELMLEKVLFILLLDAITNTTKEGYLRLHRKMTPYKIAFALDEDSKSKDTLKDLVNVLHCRLADKKISTWLPNFSLSIESQLKENLQIGVAYTAILSERTLMDGIFAILNSSTMLKEHVHVADFDSYAALLCEK